MIILSNKGTSIDRYLDHAKSDPMQLLYQAMNEGKKRLTSLPVCPRCERAGFRDKGWAITKTMSCPHCGYHGKATHQLSAYVQEGLYK